MTALPSEINDLSELLSSLPGIGPKLSSRLALYLSIAGKDSARSLSVALGKVVSDIKTCTRCGNVTTSEVCNICEDKSRDTNILLIVEDSLDLYNIESTRIYNGLYHVLNGVISPINGKGPNDINLKQLFARVVSEDITEIILALNPNVEGDSTSIFIKDEIQRISPTIRLTKLAKGIPAGSDLEYVSGQTIIDSVNSRKLFE